MRAIPIRFASHPVARCLVLLAILGTLSPILPGQESADSRVLIERLTTLLGKREGDSFWLTVGKLEAIGENAVPTLRSKLEDPGEKIRLGCAKALLQVGDRQGRQEALKALSTLATAATDKAVRVNAIEIYGLHGDPDETLDVLDGIFEESVDPQVLIPVARTLWKIDHVKKARDRLVELLSSRDLEVRYEAALTLAGIGYFEGDVRGILRSLKKEPTPRGRRAALLDRVLRLSRQIDNSLHKGELIPEGTDSTKLLKIREQRIRELEDTVERLASNPGGAAKPRTRADRVFEEVIDEIRKRYIDKSKTVRESLVLSAIKGMVRSLDPHSSFMEAKEAREFTQGLWGQYPGIGAQVVKPPRESLEIHRPIYGGPAAEAGIRSADKVLEINGVETRPLSMEEIMKLLEGPRGTSVHLKVLRRGWPAPREFELVRKTIEVPSVYHERLPEAIGYIGLTQFGGKTADEFLVALNGLEKDGLSGLIIDLRNNGGGLFHVAVRIADLFVEGDLPIVTEKGRGGDGPGEKPTFPTGGARSDYPIVVLVNAQSASASEIVSGALMDYGRASLVGKRTFGKGSVQDPIALKSWKGCQLKLTVKYYYLPLGRCIHTIRDEKGRIVEKGGIEPDVDADQETLPVWRLDERDRLRSRSEVLEYVDEHFDELAPLIPMGDLGDNARYPELEKLHEALKTRSPVEDVEAVVRFQVRRRLEDRRGRRFAFDLEADRQLQAGLLELIRLMGRKVDELPKYSWISSQLAKAAKEREKPTPEKSEP